MPAAPPTNRRRTLLAAALVALLAIGVGTYLWTRPAHRASHRAAPRPTPVVTRPTTQTTPSAPKPPPPKPGPPHQYVAPAVPTSFTLTGKQFTINAHVCAMAPVFPLDPPGEQHHTVCWVTKGFGYAPGSHSQTSYVLGHAWAEDEQEVLNKLSAPATRQILHAKPVLRSGQKTYPVEGMKGYRLILHTPTGRLTYKVRAVWGAGKLDLGSVKSVMNQHVRNRIVLITCAERNGVDYDYDIVVEAYLYSSVRAKAAKA